MILGVCAGSSFSEARAELITSRHHLLRLIHARTDDVTKDAVFRWIVGGMDALGDRKVNRKQPKAADSIVPDYPTRKENLPAIIHAFEKAKKADEKALITLITEHELPREAIPTQHLNSAAVWEALLTKMPATAMIRNLGKMTAVGLVKTFSKSSKGLCTIRPVSIIIRLSAQKVLTKPILFYLPSRTLIHLMLKVRGRQMLHMKEIKAEIKLGDCGEILKTYPENTFDLIFTSPPYADSRKQTYGGIHPDEYVKWFLPRSEQFLRTLKDTGSFVLNIKEKVVDGERHTYVLELIMALRKQGWLWTEEYVWHKKNCYPGKWPNRFRDAWERCLHFSKCRHFKMNQKDVMVPMGEWANARLKSLGENDVRRFDSQVGSGFGKNIANWLNRDMAYPSNVLHLATECGNKNHSAAFPRALPEWFIKLFTDEGDYVLDPFVGSGTTCATAQALGRNSIGIDILPEYHQMARKEIAETEHRLLEESPVYGKKNGGGDKKVHRNGSLSASPKKA